MGHLHRYNRTTRQIVAEYDSKGNRPLNRPIRVDGVLAVCRCGKRAISPHDGGYRKIIELLDSSFQPAA